MVFAMLLHRRRPLPEESAKGIQIHFFSAEPEHLFHSHRVFAVGHEASDLTHLDRRRKAFA
jgi:hypothetical protein